MKLIAKIAIAVCILIVVGITLTWFSTGGRSSGIALANVADAWDALRNATFEMTMEMNEPTTGTAMPRMVSKGMFLAPSHQRTEMQTGPGHSGIMIMDFKAGKSLMLMPEKKFAFAIDAREFMENAKKTSKEQMPQNVFEMVRRLVREGSSGPGVKVQSLGEKEIDGQKAVGFQVRINREEMTLWADPETARPVSIEMNCQTMFQGRMVMDHFAYDATLDPALFSVEPPAGYAVQSMTPPVPKEEDLIDTLRVVAEQSDGQFPPAIGMNKEITLAIQAKMKPEMEKIIEKYGKESPEMMKAASSLGSKYMSGIMFFTSLTDGNDAHYVGKGVKLDTPDHPIFWYKPTGSEKYRVIYADLSVKEVDPDVVNGFDVS